jgi:hypothetical protein
LYVSAFMNGEWIGTRILPTERIMSGFTETFRIGDETHRPGAPADTAIDEAKQVFWNASTASSARIASQISTGWFAKARRLAGGHRSEEAVVRPSVDSHARYVPSLSPTANAAKNLRTRPILAGYGNLYLAKR